jgi:lipoprotein-anchoring transpeptidase ErfK/SrfK
LPARRSIKRLIGGAAFFLLGGTTAAALSVAREPARPAVAGPVAAAIPANRIAVTPAAMRQALAAGQIDRPVKSILRVPARLQYGDFRWDDAGVPAGSLWIRVDTRAQLISVFRAGHEIGTAVILYGADGLETPTGKFPILAKLKDHRSATYDAPMPYTLRLTRDGVAIHASDVRWGLATHGCVGVPDGFARKLFAAASVGDEVFVVGASAKTA